MATCLCGGSGQCITCGGNGGTYPGSGEKCPSCGGSGTCSICGGTREVTGDALSNRRYDYRDVVPIAKYIQQPLAPGCKRIEIAGSLRRRSPTVKDIEIVAEPILEEQRDLFQRVVSSVSRLDPILVHLGATGHLSLAGKNGERYKRFKVLGGIGPKLDLFIVRPPAQWGVIFAIRTGPAKFSRRLVTPRRHGGLLPSHLHIKDGAVRQNAAPRTIIETPTEAALFELLEIDWIPPDAREG